ncbi:MAG: hypothetical protein M1815_000752, partial [Lichina confinis]
MSEQQPSDVHEGADMDEEAPTLPKSAEDRKAAAALSSVAAASGGDDYYDQRGHDAAKQLDQEALGRAMKRLDISGAATAGGGSSARGSASGSGLCRSAGGSAGGRGAGRDGRGGRGSASAGDAVDKVGVGARTEAPGSGKMTPAEEEEEAERVRRKAIKVDQADVSLL